MRDAIVVCCDCNGTTVELHKGEAMTLKLNSGFGNQTQGTHLVFNDEVAGNISQTFERA